MVDAVEERHGLADPGHADVAVGVDVIPRAAHLDGGDDGTRLDEAAEGGSRVDVVGDDTVDPRAPGKVPGDRQHAVVHESQVADPDDGRLVLPVGAALEHLGPHVEEVPRGLGEADLLGREDAGAVDADDPPRAVDGGPAAAP